MIRTVSARIGASNVDTGLRLTTPDALDVQRHQSRMVASEATHAILEATVAGAATCERKRFDAAIETNIKQEHLSAHGSFQACRKARVQWRARSGTSGPLDQPGSGRQVVREAR